MLIAVTGSKKPYLYDLPAVLALQKGGRSRFRYRQVWVDNRLLRDLRRGGGYQQRELLLVFHSLELGRLVPLRWARVERIQEVGPLVHVCFSVSDYVDASQELPDLDGERTSLRRAGALLHESIASAFPVVREYGAQVLRRPLARSQYLFESEIPLATSRSPSVQAWARLVALLSLEPQFHGVPFFRVLGFQQMWGADRSQRVQPDINGRFCLMESRSYRLQIVEWRPSEGRARAEVVPVEVSCTVRADLVRLDGASDVVVGPYDVLEYEISAVSTGVGEIHLRAQPPPCDDSPAPDGSDAWRSWPMIFAARVPIRVVRDIRRAAAHGFSGIAGSVLYAASDELTAGPPVSKALELVGLALMWYAAASFLGAAGAARRALGAVETTRGPTISG